MSILFFIVVNFYILASVVSVDIFFYVSLILAVLTDGLFIAIHLPRKAMKHSKLTFDPKKLTVLIICYNGEDIIEETIHQAKKHVPIEQIFVVSDKSTDNTDEVAAATGARVFRNSRNVNKAFSINAVMKYIETPYTLLLDDDTLIGKTFIPTSLLDEGYDAVAFNVMPVEEDYLINALQRFEYRKSMQIGKNLRSKAGAIGNVSGAIGLFHTKDLQKQSTMHSGQFGGEDEQRTILTHLMAEGKGIAYTDSTVLTYAPKRFRHLYKQRAFSWNLSTPELFYLYWKLLLDSRHHFLLKAEKAYSIYIYVTDPLRILFFWILFTRPTNIFVTYGFYAILSLMIWIKTGRKDKLYVALLFPLYSFVISIFRFIGHFYWFKLKFVYFFKYRFHRKVPDRRLLAEFALILIVNIGLWTTAIMHFKSDVNLLRRVQDHRIDEFDTSTFSYTEEKVNAQAPAQANQPTQANSVKISLAVNESNKSLSHKLLNAYLMEKPGTVISDDSKLLIEDYLAEDLAKTTLDKNQMSLTISNSVIENAIGRVQIR